MQIRSHSIRPVQIRNEPPVNCCCHNSWSDTTHVSVTETTTLLPYWRSLAALPIAGTQGLRGLSPPQAASEASVAKALSIRARRASLPRLQRRYTRYTQRHSRAARQSPSHTDSPNEFERWRSPARRPALTTLPPRRNRDRHPSLCNTTPQDCSGRQQAPALPPRGTTSPPRSDRGDLWHACIASLDCIAPLPTLVRPRPGTTSALPSDFCAPRGHTGTSCPDCSPQPQIPVVPLPDTGSQLSCR